MTKEEKMIAKAYQQGFEAALCLSSIDAAPNDIKSFSEQEIMRPIADNGGTVADMIIYEVAS